MTEEKRPAVSIIMPVYKVEDCVGAAIQSISSQTFADWELFAVDDGSPDASGDICEEYARKDPRIHVIHKENGGAPSARNEAIPLARGKYFYFMDSDDLAEDDMLEKMVQAMEKTGAQLLLCGYYIDTYHSETEYMTQEISDKTAEYDRDEFRKNAYRLFDKNMLYTPWNKLYLADYIREKGILFPDTLWDDFPFNLSVIRDVEKVCVLEEKFYHSLVPCHIVDVQVKTTNSSVVTVFGLLNDIFFNCPATNFFGKS